MRPDSAGFLTRNEFKSFLALLYRCAQEGHEV